MDLVATLIPNAVAVLAMVTTVWLLSLALKNASIVDVFWGLGFIAIAWLSWRHSDRGPHATLLAALVTTWGTRLALYIGARNYGKPEDHRYVAFREKYRPFWWKSYFIVFLLQGVLMLLVSLPVQLDMNGDVTALDVVGAVVFVVGFLFEAIGDQQLAAHKRAHPGEVMRTGLWRYTRHPNYFGELVLWWGIGIASLSAALAPSSSASSASSAWLNVGAALIGPALISFLLLRVSGVPMLEAAMKKRGPAYVDYIKATSSFIPRRPRST